MKRILLLVCSLWCGYAFAQTNAQATTSAKKTMSDVSTQEAQENEWAKKLFAESYKKEHHEKYTGKIRVKSDVFGFEKSAFLLKGTKTSFKGILSNGLLYPKLFEADIQVSENDTLTLHQIEELPFLNVEPKSKRFRFAISTKNLLNPTVYFIELTNVNATSKTSLTDFIKGSSLTFFIDGWTQI